MSNDDFIKLEVVYDRVLGVQVARGYARLCDLARMSKADVFDQETNPEGTQRDLSPKHAKDAYDYIVTHDLGFWPEIFLCVRDKKSVEIHSQSDTCGELAINMRHIRRTKNICISRVDGNHRLHYADGETAGYEPVEKKVSFCMAIGLSRKQEIRLFMDINNNQRRMSTTHLDNIVSRISPEEKLKREDPALYIAKQLGEDQSSPLYQRVHYGSTTSPASKLPLRALKTGVSYMLSRPTRLTSLPDTEAKYKVIKNYFFALKNWVPEAWENPKDYVMLRGAGLWGVCFLGAYVIDKTLGQGRFTDDAMLRLLKSGSQWDWTTNGDFKGLSGRGGAVKISDTVSKELSDEGGVSIQELYRKIMVQ
jgi:DGQHR domain-containing protein